VEAGERHRLISRIVDEFELRGWREDGYTAMAIAALLAGEGAPATTTQLESIVTSRFLARNHASLSDVRDAVASAVRGFR
jgi:hypothetical protein